MSAFSAFFFFFNPPSLFWKQYDVKELHSTKTIMEVMRGLCKTSSVWVLLEWSLQWLDFWIIRQAAHIVTSTVYGAEANTDKFDSHASVSAKTLVTRSLAKRAIRAMETVCPTKITSSVRGGKCSAQLGCSRETGSQLPDRGQWQNQPLSGTLFPIQLHQQNIAKKRLSRMM